MKLKTLILQKNLREDIAYNSYSLPLSVCTDKFDDYFQSEWECHWHDELEFGILQNGCAQFNIYNDSENICYVLHPGDGIFINSGCLHSAKALLPDTIISEFVLSEFFPKQLLKNVSEQYPDLLTQSAVPGFKLYRSNSEDQPLISSIEEIFSVAEQEPASILHFVEIVCRIWRLLTNRISEASENAAYASLNHTQETRLKQMLSYIHSHYNEKITVDDIAASCAVSRTECFRCFRIILQKTPAKYLEEYRLSMSAVFLSNLELSISDVASMCGFNSTSYFCKLFQKRYGFSPGKYRQQ